MTTAELFEKNRPEGFIGQGDHLILQGAEALFEALTEIIENFNRPRWQLEEHDIRLLAIALMEFAEDLHNNTGLWEAVEEHNRRIFGVIHPLFPEDVTDPSPFRIVRVKAFLLYLYEELKHDHSLSPHDPDLMVLSNFVSAYLKQVMPPIPLDSGINHFFSCPNDDVVTVKAKLIWLGSRSYLFRLFLTNHASSLAQKMTVSLLDDFLCQQCSHLSGLGALDLLAAILDIDETQRRDLLSWNQRHMAFYKVISTNKSRLQLVNLINEKPYDVNSGEFTSEFLLDDVIFGSLVPWNDDWYWSGEQKIYTALSDEKIGQVKENFLKAAAQISYRYDKEALKNVESIIKIHYQEFLDYFQDDLAVFSNGLDLAAAMQKKDRAVYKAKMSEEELAVFMEKHHLNQPNPNYSYPDELIESTDGIGVFFNPREGMEFAMNFTNIITGFEKKGRHLNEDEQDSIIQFILSYSLSHDFARKLINRYGPESLLAAFCLKGYDPDLAAEYLLRKYKGHFYKERFPNIYVVDSPVN